MPPTSPPPVSAAANTSRSSPARAAWAAGGWSIVAGEFGFLGGSIGVVAAEILVAALERATRERLPVLAAPTSGGTRMQEGTIAFLQMVKITQAVAAHKRAGLPYVVYLRHPTTGGVFASWGSLGHITVAEPGALIGFLGPRVYEALYGAPFPAGVQTAENLYAHSLLDGVMSADELDGWRPRPSGSCAATWWARCRPRPRPRSSTAPTRSPGRPAGPRPRGSR